MACNVLVGPMMISSATSLNKSQYGGWKSISAPSTVGVGMGKRRDNGTSGRLKFTVKAQDESMTLPQLQGLELQKWNRKFPVGSLVNAVGLPLTLAGSPDWTVGEESDHYPHPETLEVNQTLFFMNATDSEHMASENGLAYGTTKGDKKYTFVVAWSNVGNQQSDPVVYTSILEGDRVDWADIKAKLESRKGNLDKHKHEIANEEARLRSSITWWSQAKTPQLEILFQWKTSKTKQPKPPSGPELEPEPRFEPVSIFMGDDVAVVAT